MKKLLASLMMLLLLVQTLFASADVHQLHQPVQGHLERSLAVATPECVQPVINLEQDIPSDQVKKCQHCCHCHGSGVAYVSGQSASQFFAETAPVIASLSLNPATGLSTPELRPPIV
jgi:hypothetical protein